MVPSWGTVQLYTETSRRMGSIMHGSFSSNWINRAWLILGGRLNRALNLLSEQSSAHGSFSADVSSSHVFFLRGQFNCTHNPFGGQFIYTQFLLNELLFLARNLLVNGSSDHGSFLGDG